MMAATDDAVKLPTIVQASRADEVTSARRRAYVDAARSAFFSAGFAATTMSSIAARVGGSKTTLWSYFASKEALFAAVVDDVVERYGEALSVPLPPDRPPTEVLPGFAEALMATILSDPVTELYRLVVGEATRFPHLAALFHARGPERGKQRLADYLEAQMGQGRLRTGNPLAAAQQFVALCQAGEYQRALLKLEGEADRSRLEADMRAAGASFLRAWAPTAG